LDEFPYLVASDASLPSVVQLCLDLQLPVGITLVLSGSSTSAMNDLFLNWSAPFYQRARKQVVLVLRERSFPGFKIELGEADGPSGSVFCRAEVF
jgi:hypothetical protein